MRRSSRAAMLLFAVAFESPKARGGPLDPGAFASLGTLNITGGSYTFNTTTDQLLDCSGNVLFTGVTSNGIAVFDFSQITISGGTFTATGSVSSTGMTGQPLALAVAGEHQLHRRQHQRLRQRPPTSCPHRRNGGSGGVRRRHRRR